MSRTGPLEQVTSIKLKLGLLVAVSVLVAAVLATLGAGTVPALLGIPVTVLLALGVTQLLAVGMTSPLRQMTEAARRMAAGDYDVRVSDTATDEVGELARAFNRMAADLAGVDRQRRELVATVSHELRTPLAALVAVLENLDDGVTEPDPATIRTALGQAERLGDLVSDLLDLSRVDAGVVALERTDVALAALLAEASAQTPGGVRVEIEVQPPGLMVPGDPSRLHQLVANLLDNAVRHSPPGGTVRVRAGESAGVVRLEVSDEGPGIAAVDRERVFERFGTSSDGGGGTGLGLAIVRWVTDLHGGRVLVADPSPGRTGARLLVELPTHPTENPRRDMITSAPAAPSPSPVVTTGLVDGAFGPSWREDDVPARRGVLLACLAVGVLAGLTLPYALPGLAWTLVLLAAGGLVLWVSRARGEWFTWTSAALCAGFAVMVSVRDATWIVVLGLLVSAVLVASSLTRARTLSGMVLGCLAWPFAGLRGLPWLGRTLRSFGGTSGSRAAVRTVLVSAVALLVFGGLFASGDAIVGSWLDALVPDVGDSVVLRVFVTVAVAGVVLAAGYLAINPPTTDPAPCRRPAAHRFEWLAPVLLVDAVFALFLAAQAAALLGGHDYVRRATGLTYADYVHQGFAQLTIATLLMLLVVWAAARKASDTPTDGWWLRGSLGLLCVLTLTVVASALHRMDLYQDAYGFTRLRLLVDVFEGWLGLVVLGVMVAGIRLRGGWLPRVALLSGAAAVLSLAIANPDAWIARHNLERYDAVGKIDVVYLGGLSADALPVILDHPLPEAVRCPLDAAATFHDFAGSWNEWNVSRARAEELVAPHSRLPNSPVRCP